MRIEDIKTVAVIGSGTMGHAISQVCAGANFRVIMTDTEESRLQAGLERIKGSLQRIIKAGKMTEEASVQALSRISTTTDMKAAIKEADYVIEAVYEDMALKKRVHAEMAGASKPQTILASNTSTLSITEIGSATTKPDKVIGMHFFNPVPMMPAIEIIRGVLTSDETVETVKGMCDKLGRIAIVVKDSPGFLSVRLGLSIYMEASKMLQEGVASAKDLDAGAKLFYGHKIGPFETCDLVGLDARLNNLNAMYQATADPKWAPPLLLKQLVASGYLGRKPGSKGGYYTFFGIETK